MASLMRLVDIPYRARAAEARERAKWPTRRMALDAATYAICAAPGCYGGAYPPVFGWVLTREAADAVCGVVTNMPGGSSHRRCSCEERTGGSAALDAYIQSIADGVGSDVALAAYNAARDKED